MKHFILIAISLFTLASCSAKKGIVEKENLPKDSALKPDPNSSQEEDQVRMKNLIQEIDSLISAQPCTNKADWKFTPIGAKACGGPSSYLAYPQQLEGKILPKVAQFTAMHSAFNSKYGLMSDCAIVLPPAEITCENGKAVLIADR